MVSSFESLVYPILGFWEMGIGNVTYDNYIKIFKIFLHAPKMISNFDAPVLLYAQFIAQFLSSIREQKKLRPDWCHHNYNNTGYTRARTKLIKSLIKLVYDDVIKVTYYTLMTSS